MLFDMYNKADEEVVKKWTPVLEAEDVAPITDVNVKFGTARLLENAEKFMNEATPGTTAGNVAGLDPAILSMVRRMGPTILGNQLVGVQPMQTPNAQIFALRPRYTNSAGAEVHKSAPDSAFTGLSSDGTKGNVTPVATDTVTDPMAAVFTTGTAMDTATGEGDVGAEFSVTVDAVPVIAQTRTSKASMSYETLQDLSSQHGIDGRALFSGLLAEQLAAETNYEILRKLYISAVLGSSNSAVPGTFNLAVDSDGRWTAEDIRLLALHILQEATEIMQNTRLGHGNFAVVSSNVYNALFGAGLISDAGPSNTMFAGSNPVIKTNTPGIGILLGSITVYRDDYARPAPGKGFVLVGWKGNTPVEAGFFYAPYIPAFQVETHDENSFQPRMAWKSRYGLAASPLADTNGAVVARTNPFYRIFAVSSITI